MRSGLTLAVGLILGACAQAPETQARFGAPAPTTSPSGVETSTKAPAASPTLTSPPIPSTPTPTAPTPRAVTVTFTSVRSPVSRGGTGQVTVSSSADTSCSITVTYSSGPSSAQGLAPKVTDAAGAVSWSWTIGTNTTRGTWPIDVRCGSTSARTTFVVQ